MSDSEQEVVQEAEVSASEPQHFDRNEIDTSNFNHDELRAFNNGWVPKEYWQGDPSEAKSAKQFNEKGDLISKINSSKHQVQSLQDQVAELANLIKTEKEYGRKQALEELKKQKVAALDNADSAAVVDIDDKISELSKPSPVEEKLGNTVTRQTGLPPVQQYAVDTWLPQNEWYNRDPAVQQDFNTVLNGALLNLGKPEDQITPAEMQQAFDYATRLVQPRVATPRTTRSNPVMGQSRTRGSNVTNNSGKVTVATLTEAQKAAGDVLVQNKTYASLEDYVKRLNGETLKTN